MPNKGGGVWVKFDTLTIRRGLVSKALTMAKFKTDLPNLVVKASDGTTDCLQFNNLNPIVYDYSTDTVKSVYYTSGINKNYYIIGYAQNGILMGALGDYANKYSLNSAEINKKFCQP